MKNRIRQAGFTLIELMLSITIGLIIIAATVGLFIGQKQMFSSANSLADIQNSDNAINALLVPLIRGAGFAGCGALSGTTAGVVSTLNTNSVAPLPLGNYAVSPVVSTYVQGYEASGTGSAASISITTLDAANDSTVSDWSPSLDATLAGSVEKGSDVLVVLGPVPGAGPTGTTVATTGAGAVTVQSTSAFTSATPLAAISDCGKTEIFAVTSQTSTTLTHAVGSGPLGNATASFTVNFTTGAQVVPMQEAALFMGNNTDGHSALMMATYTSSGWAIQPLIPGVEAFQVLYGVGSNNLVTAYVPASSITDWTSVLSVRIGLLLEGQSQSVSGHSTAGGTFKLLGQTITTPADGILRHTDELTINLRNL